MVYNNDISNLLKLSLGDIIELYRLSDKYMVTSICNHCIQHIKNMLNTASVDTLITIFDFAYSLEDKRLLIAVKQVIAEIRVKVGDKLNNLSEQVFYEYMQFLFQLDGMTANTLFSAMNAYFLDNNLFPVEDDPKEIHKISNNVEQAIANSCKKDQKDIDKTSKKDDNDKMVEKNEGENKDAIKEIQIVKHDTFQRKLLNLIDFNQMSVQDFIDGPGKSRFLTLEQKYDKLSQKIKIEHNYS